MFHHCLYTRCVALNKLNGEYVAPKVWFVNFVIVSFINIAKSGKKQSHIEWHNKNILNHTQCGYAVEMRTKNANRDYFPFDKNRANEEQIHVNKLTESNGMKSKQYYPIPKNTHVMICRKNSEIILYNK